MHFKKLALLYGQVYLDYWLTKVLLLLTELFGQKYTLPNSICAEQVFTVFPEAINFVTVSI